MWEENLSDMVLSFAPFYFRLGRYGLLPPKALSINYKGRGVNTRKRVKEVLTQEFEEKRLA